MVHREYSRRRSLRVPISATLAANRDYRLSYLLLEHSACGFRVYLDEDEVADRAHERSILTKPDLRQAAVDAASAEGVSLNKWIADCVREAAKAA